MDCFCTPRYQCLSCEKAEKGYKVVKAPRTKTYTSTNRKVAECGTRAGYNKHRRLGEPTCTECRAAQTKAVTRWQRQNPKETAEIRKRYVENAK